MNPIKTPALTHKYTNSLLRHDYTNTTGTVTGNVSVSTEHPNDI